MWALLLLPVSLFSGQGSAAAVTAPAINAAPLTGLPPAPGRDDADQDSVYYEYGFEDGWGGWSAVDLTDPGNMWHPSEEHAFEGRSWWCADEELGGYDNHWLQYLMTPVLDLRERENLRLRFMAYWSVESPDVGQVPPEPYDAWDGCNLWISTNGGDDWEVIEPVRPRYNYRNLYSFGEEWNMGANIPGWCASSGNEEWPEGEWVDAEFNLDNYARENVRIRWAFCSDPGWATGDENDPDGLAFGFLVDNLEIVAGEDIVWSNNGDEQGDMEFDTGPHAGDHWEITEDDAHNGDFSAHCPLRANLQNALVSPPLEIPGEEWYTYFDFWVRCDTRTPNSNPDEDNSLDDLFEVWVSEDGNRWDRMIYDYADTARQDPNNPDRWYLPHHLHWWYGFGYFGPDTTFNDVAEWKRKLNLSQFAGQTIWLRWIFKTDDYMQEPQGSGLYIDDFRLKISTRREFDVGVEWVYVPYPTSFDFTTVCSVMVHNFGLARQDQIRKFYRIDDNDLQAITPWTGLEAGDSRAYPFEINDPPYPYADMVDLTVYMAVNNDQVPENDAVTNEGIIIYPPGVWMLGYDSRDYELRFDLDQGHGSAVLFTPGDDGIDGEFDIKAIRVLWNGAEGNAGSHTTLHIFKDDNDEPGEELYSTELTIEHLLPETHIIDLTEVEAVQGLNANFWVWFELGDDAPFPQIIGDHPNPELYFGAGHYFDFDGETLEEVVNEYQIHAVLMPADASGTELVVGRNEIDFENIDAGVRHTERVALFNGSTNEVTVTGVEIDNDIFRLEPDFDLPLTLAIGDMALLYVSINTEELGEYFGVISFTCNDEEPPVVAVLANVLGVGDEGATPPMQFSLGAAHPNPFNAAAVIPFELPRSADVTLAVYDLAGREVARLAQGRLPAGRHSATFNGAGLTTGLYIYKLEAGKFTGVKKMVLVK